jgi:hypothetical protein
LNQLCSAKAKKMLQLPEGEVDLTPSWPTPYPTWRAPVVGETLVYLTVGYFEYETTELGL